MEHEGLGQSGDAVRGGINHGQRLLEALKPEQALVMAEDMFGQAQMIEGLAGAHLVVDAARLLVGVHVRHFEAFDDAAEAAAEGVDSVLCTAPEHWVVEKAQLVELAVVRSRGGEHHLREARAGLTAVIARLDRYRGDFGVQPAKLFASLLAADCSRRLGDADGVLERFRRELSLSTHPGIGAGLAWAARLGFGFATLPLPQGAFQAAQLLELAQRLNPTRTGYGGLSRLPVAAELMLVEGHRSRALEDFKETLELFRRHLPRDYRSLRDTLDRRELLPS